MSDGHCFISYTNAKTEQVAIQLATKLADKLKGEPPHIDVWIDNRSIHAGNWDEQVSVAIKTCKCVLFIVSPDSVTPNSICADELDWALRYKKTIIPLIAYENAEIPFRLSRRKFVDFTGDFETALSQLRNLIAWLDTPEGELQKLNDRLADAQRDLRRYPEQTNRIEKEIEELNSQIQVQERIVADPKAAEKQTQDNIAAGLERERQPVKPTAAQTSTKFINPPPGIAPTYFQDRYIETEQIAKFLQDDSQRMMTIVGRGGVGKTAMVCRLLKGLEGGELPDGLGRMRAEGIVYLSESGSHRVNFANLFYDLCKLLPTDAANALDAVYKNPQASTASKMSALLDRFTAGKVVLLLDNVEPLISVETFDIADAELDECLRALLHGAHSALKVILTTRVAPRGLNLCEPGRQRVLTLDSGLEQKYAVEMLREMDVDGKLGLKSGTDEALGRACERTLGFPRALEALFAILASDRYTTLEELLAMPTPVNVVEALVGEAFNRLDTNAQKVMQALAVYNRPVTPAAVDYLLAPHIPAIDSAPILQRLANMHFARKESGRFYLHPVDREFAFGLLPEGHSDDKVRSGSGLDLMNYFATKMARKHPELLENPTDKEHSQEAFQEIAKDEDPELIRDLTTAIQSLDPDLLQKMQDPNNFGDENFVATLDRSLQILQVWTRYALMFRAADYFRQARKPRTEWKKLDDLSAQLAEFDLRCAAGDYDTAASVLIEIDGDYLFLWGHYRLMIDSHEKLQEKIIDSNLTMRSLGSLGSANAYIGKINNAIFYQDQALLIARERKDRSSENSYLNNLGNRYFELGNAHTAIEFYEQALVIARELSDPALETFNLGNLGNAYNILGNTDKAIEYYEQALAIDRKIGDRSGEESDLINMAEALVMDRQYAKAIATAKLSIPIAIEIGIPATYEYGILAEAYLFSENLNNALLNVTEAQKFDEPKNNHNISTLLGIIALRQGDDVAARGAFVRALGQADDILSKTAEYYSALDAKGLALCGLILCRGAVPAPDGDGANTGRGDPGQGNPAPTVDDAIETFRKARKIAPHAGVVKSVLRLFDELAKCEGGEILGEVRSAVEGVE